MVLFKLRVTFFYIRIKDMAVFPAFL